MRLPKATDNLLAIIKMAYKQRKVKKGNYHENL